MKKLYVLMMLIYLSLPSIGQDNDITGLWQYKTAEVYSGLLDNYKFDGKKHTFEFRTNEMDGLNRIISIGGEYEIKQDTLFFYTKYTLEYEGGYPVRSMTTTLSDSWELEGGEIKKNDLSDKKLVEKVTIKQAVDKNIGLRYILIDGKVFYQIKSDLQKEQESLNDSIRHYLKEGRVEGILSLFEKNLSSNNSFPTKNEDIVLLFDYVDRHKLIKKKESYLVIFKLSFYNKSNVEFQEYYHDLIPALAIEDLSLFVETIGYLNTHEQECILENLEYLPNLKAINAIRNQLKIIETPKNKECIVRINIAIDKIFE